MGIDSVTSDQRKFKRVVFSAKDQVLGIFKSSKGSDNYFSFKIADISAGGLQFFIMRQADQKFKPGDKFILKKIWGITDLAFVVDIELDAKWVLGHELFKHMVVGCEFLNISEALQSQIDSYVQFMLNDPNKKV